MLIRVLQLYFFDNFSKNSSVNQIQHGPWDSTLRFEIACERDFYVLRSHINSTHFEPFNFTLNFRNHCFSTLFEPTNFSQSYSSTCCAKGMIARNLFARTVYYNSDFEIFEKNWVARDVYYRDDFEAHKNLSHNQFEI